MTVSKSLVVFLLLGVLCLGIWILMTGSSGPGDSLPVDGSASARVHRDGKVQSEEALQESHRVAMQAMDSAPLSRGNPVHAKVVVLELSSGKPVGGLNCRWIANLGGLSRVVITDRKGRFDLPALSGRIESLDPEIAFVSPHLRSTPGATQVVWCSRRRGILVSAIDENRKALPDVSIFASVNPSGNGASAEAVWWQRNWIHMGRTSKQGTLRFVPPMGPGLILSAQLPGHRTVMTPCSDADLKRLQFIMAMDLTGFVTLEVRDAQTGMLLTDVDVSGPLGPVSVRQSEDQKHVIQASSIRGPGQRAIRIAAKGYCPSKLAFTASRYEEPFKVALHKACELTIRSIPRHVDASISLRVVEGGEEGSSPLIPQGFQYTGQDVTVVVPRQVPLEISSIRRDGRSARQSLMLSDSSKTLTLAYGMTEDELRISLSREAGKPIANPMVRLRLQNGTLASIVGDRQGRFRLGALDRIEELRIYAKGFGTVRLRPRDPETSSQERAGSLPVTLKKASLVRIRFADDSGEPVVGIRVGVLGEDSRDAMRVNPKLNGFRATQHPAWCRKNQPNQRFETDGSGLVECWLTDGDYTVGVDVPWIRRASHWMPSGYPARRFDFHVRGSTTIDFSIPKPIPVTISTFSSLTRKPLSSMIVTSEISGVGSYGVVPTGEVELWVPSDIEKLRVGSPSYVTKVVSIAEQEGEHSRLEVYLDPATAGTIQVEDLPPALEGRSVQVVAFKEATSSPSKVGESVWQSRIRLHPDRTMDLHVPLGGPLYVYLLPVVIGDATYSFDALDAIWRASGHLRFSCRKHNRKPR